MKSRPAPFLGRGEFKEGLITQRERYDVTHVTAVRRPAEGAWEVSEGLGTDCNERGGFPIPLH